ncbi:hypothetical protein A2118_00215 [Candidatus Kaiserbacteria bacterium GWA2_50_9]|uniref:DUF6884 domain-containing protein n=1 Tax=Candidatus Kaiserbacteria bacterium GWA2_50_9 TaxID=1798474 RepID=A0A1F6BSV4_9BACT|nr:MAG: hypothetical protein A2118_00215 [Candidatus Kaiserbacteria bacterium GWA2_50_9]
MRRIVLISCVSTKLGKPAKARDLYISPLFRFNLAYAESLKPDMVFILSAKYGLVPLNRKIAPYNETLNTKRNAAKKIWANKVLHQLKAKTDLKLDEFILLAGERYRRFLLPHLARVRIPLKGLGLGRQLQFLKRTLV